MSIKVLSPGLLTTIQDNGRYGYQKYGVIVSGAMDTSSMKLANIVVGNDENEGVLEITIMGPSLEVPKGNLIAVTGADISPTIGGEKVPLGAPLYLKEDSLLEFGGCISGCRCYLAVAGGFDVPSFMGSRSTYLRAGIGGKDGRALKKGDILEVGSKSEVSERIIHKLESSLDNAVFSAANWHVKNFCRNNSGAAVIRVFEDRQFERVEKDSVEKFLNSDFTIDVKSDRMGYRLYGPKIKFNKNIEMISGEVSFGTIQIPPDGNPIILLADRATAGGYPKIAHVAYFDMEKLVQLKPSDKIRFKKIGIDEAEQLYLKKEKYIKKLKKSVELMSI